MMKKILLTLGIAFFGLAASSYAQVILTQDFGAPTVPPALPSTWSQGSTGTPGWFTSTDAGTTWGSLTGYYNIPTHGTYVVVDDAANPLNIADTLKSPVFSASGYTNVWMSYQFFFFDAYNGTSNESCYVLASSNGGSTWTVIDSLYGNAFDGTDTWATGYENLSAFTGSNCRIAFAYSDGGSAVLGCALDSIQIYSLPQDSVVLTAIGYNDLAAKVSTNGVTLYTEVTNNGGNTITSVSMYYTLNGGTPVAQTFSGLSISGYSAQVFAFSTPFSGLVSGTNNLKVAISAVNGVANNGADSVINSSFVLASATPQRNGLIEEFSSSTCNPCAYFNADWDPLVSSLSVNNPSTHINELKYQMNWPDWDDDRSYNANGADRQTYYGVDAIPTHFINGAQSTYNSNLPFASADYTYYTNEIHGSDTDKAYMDMSTTYYVDTLASTLSVTVTVTPHFTATGGTFHVLVAAADQHYQNIDNEWGQLDYYNVERMMFPSGLGTSVTSWTDGVPQTFTFTNQPYTAGNWTLATTTHADTSIDYPAMNSSTFWSNPLLGSEIIAFVQEDGDGSVMQSMIAYPTNDGALSVSTLSGVSSINIYPNPTKNTASVQFGLAQSGNVEINVVDYTGRIVSQVTNQNMNAGNQVVSINTENIVPGNYLVTIKTYGGMNTQRLTVIK